MTAIDRQARITGRATPTLAWLAACRSLTYRSQAERPGANVLTSYDDGRRTPSGHRHVPPRRLPAFLDALPTRPKTPVQGGGGLRPRWKDAKGRIYEWDSRHGTVEVYDRTGRRHRGEFDPVTGDRTGPADPARRVEP